MRHRVQGQDLLETEPCEHRVMTTGSQLKGRAEHGALQCDLQRCCVGQGHSSTGHAAPNQRHAAGSQRPPVIPGVGMDRAPAKRAAEELQGASGKSSQQVRMFPPLVQQQNIYLCVELGRIHEEDVRRCGGWFFSVTRMSYKNADTSPPKDIEAKPLPQVKVTVRVFPRASSKSHGRVWVAAALSRRRPVQQQQRLRRLRRPRRRGRRAPSHRPH